MAKQRQLLNARLGLDAAEKLGMDTSFLFTNEDLISNNGKPETSNNVDLRVSKFNTSLIVDYIVIFFQKNITEVISCSKEGLSSREMNRAKRKARQAVNKQRSREAMEENNGDEGERKKMKTEVKEEYTIQYGKIIQKR